MSRLVLLGPAREAAGVRSVEIDAGTLGEVLAAASARFGSSFAEILAHSRVWVNGSDASATQPVGPSDEVAVIPPISGG